MWNQTDTYLDRKVKVTLVAQCLEKVQQVSREAKGEALTTKIVLCKDFVSFAIH